MAGYRQLPAGLRRSGERPVVMGCGWSRTPTSYGWLSWQQAFGSDPARFCMV